MEEKENKKLITKPNKGKKVLIRVRDREYLRFPIKTHVITKIDSIFSIVDKYATPLLKDNDILVIAESVVAITQGRAYHIKDIIPSPISKLIAKVELKPLNLSKSRSESIEMMIREAGLVRILIGSLLTVITRPLGIRGLFYKFVGHGLNALDGPMSYKLPPYNNYVTLGPKNPNGVVQKIKQYLKKKRKLIEVVIVDANDIDVRIEGSTDSQLNDLIREVMKDNPLGQSREQTPIGIIRQKE